VCVFRRRNAGAGGAVDEGTGGAEPGNSEDRPEGAGSAFTPAKGRPTPKRSEAERKRRNPSYVKPGDKAGQKQARTRDRTERARKYEAMKRGEEWALQPRDKGPVKALTRDYVDSRRRFSEYYMYILIVMLLVLFIRSKAIQAFLYPVVLVMVLVIVIEGYTIARGVRKLAAVRYPGQSTRGVTVYAIMRTLQLRRFRLPTPRIKPGDKF
jgi:Protein of unknown function (DUF3043)